MRVNADKCIGCLECIPYCNVNAISPDGEGRVEIDPAVCVQCWVCYRNEACPQEAIEKTPLETFGDMFKHVISDPSETTEETGVPGRGTEESKTNDVTGRFGADEVGIAIDMGRPGVGCYMRDVQKVAMAVAAAGVRFAGAGSTPLAKLMSDPETGRLQDDVLDLHVLSVIIEGKVEIEGLPQVLQAIREVEGDIATVFSLGLIARVDEDGHTPVLDMIEASGLPQPERGKVNMGLGRPLAHD